jgi:predicted DCC family thiol-disulfide oxidoreductase YuxK
MQQADESIWLLWDGDCDFCRCLAGKVEILDAAPILTIISYQLAPSPPMTPALRILAARQVQVVTSAGRRYAGADAILFALESVGWHAGFMRLLRRRPFRWGARAGYWFIARNRSRLGALCQKS